VRCGANLFRGEMIFDKRFGLALDDLT